MEILLAAILSLMLVAATVMIHYEVLLGTSRLIPHISIRARGRVLVVIGGIFVAHVLEICLYAAAYYLMHNHIGLGSIGGDFQGELLDFFYFSATCYTTLGIGDVHPEGPLRVVASIEALNGFVLIAWSASFTYLAMQQTWSRDNLMKNG